MNGIIRHHTNYEHLGKVLAEKHRRKFECVDFLPAPFAAPAVRHKPSRLRRFLRALGR